MHLNLSLSKAGSQPPPEMLLNWPSCGRVVANVSSAQDLSIDCTYQSLVNLAPSFVIADYRVAERSGIEVHYLRGHDAAAMTYAQAAEKLVPFLSDWFGEQHEKARSGDLPDPKAAPFESGAWLLLPLTNVNLKLAGLAAAHQLTHASFRSFRPWIEEGLAHFAQALYLEHETGRQAALDYMAVHRSGLVESERGAGTTRLEDEVNRSLVNTLDEGLYRSKAMCVWWMLRDLVGDSALKRALAAYHPDQDKEPSYMPHLIAAQTQRDLGWFFEDWVYHDRGLPDFKVESAYPQKTSTNTFLVAITVDNLGGAGAEVPLTAKFAGGDVTKRLEVRAKSKATIRVETPAPPLEVVVNDGSVPESNMTNNVFKIEVPGSSPGSTR